MATPTGGGSLWQFVSESGSTVIDALSSGVRWGTSGAGSPVALTFSFPSGTAFFDTGDYPSGSEVSSYSSLNATQQAAARLALQAWANVANITFTEIADNATVVGDIRIALNRGAASESGHAYFPGGIYNPATGIAVQTNPSAGDVWLNSLDSSNFSPALDTDGFQTLVHEIGHALGLKHPFSDQPTLPASQDNWQYTVMSYTSNGYLYPVTPMLDDILAIQYLYGANMSYNAGNNNYTFTGSEVLTLWDAGGTDTITGSGNINLTQGSFSLVSGAKIAIAFSTVIENATGATTADNIIGNSVSNSLRGFGGADTIAGSDGDDWIEGETGNDPLPVGQVAGNDNLNGKNGNDTILGGAGNDLLFGGAGIDFLIGELGNDLIYGGSEFDAIDGRQGSDVLYGEGGDDIIFGDGYYYIFGFANDSLFGGPGNDIMMGEAGENSTSGSGDAIYGEDGNDLLDGGGGDDAIFGGNGNDVIDGDHGNDYIVGGPGADIMLGSNAVAYGGPTTGSDLFVYQSMGDSGDSIFGFDTRAGDTDGLDLRGLFDALGYAGTTPRAAGTEMLRVVQSGADALVQIDPDGAPGPQAYVTLVSLVGVTATSITDNYFLFQ